LPASAQSTLLLFFSVTLFAILAQLAHCFLSFLKKINKPIHPQGKKKRLHSNRHHRAALAPEKQQLKAIIHNM
jgi:hypothetical protein